MRSWRPWLTWTTWAWRSSPTACPRCSGRGFARLGLDRYFDAIVVSAEVGVAKPAPAIFDRALGDLGGPPRARTLMIGDSFTSDLRGGRDAGLATCWYNPQRRAAAAPELVDHEIAAHAEVLALVG
jgi:5'-nucleotidase